MLNIPLRVECGGGDDFGLKWLDLWRKGGGDLVLDRNRG
jgi:hypothetical protein